LNSVQYRVLGILVLLVAGVAGAQFIDAGHTTSWPFWARFALGAALLFAIIGAVVILHSILSPQHSALSLAPVDDHRGPTLRHGLLVAVALFLLFFVLAKVLAMYAGIPDERTFVAGFGLALAWCTVRKPWWFWDHWKAGLLRKLIGDSGTTVVYFLIAGVLLYLAFWGDPSSLFR
jgi:hypothetical protein